jgi:hypothetical protein
MTSIFCGLPFTNLWQHSTIHSGKSKDLASTFLVPLGTRAITASWFIGCSSLLCLILYVAEHYNGSQKEKGGALS